ncbi:hypothetical protein CH253_22740 [Rhodococcus sp. 06-156-3C]|uniref:hypothetical protein n=1 Tax=Rhodococcus sp. 06-156-3C TaxID=2022486 RepID=UPI000B9B8744|nr:MULTISPECIES: hypothetical protein [unclassified Rhodococcus (in: high G+C Gram-positive bacteria)]OZD12022.1 hypothetical protein CH248_28860 [Rhodococcus sp. 06-156-4a]OZD15787.1 hypothetical protein CH253_22740 [Rhodococcus sp. 06-156-3C]OZD21171.1 hypothetical protein CH280_02970 [Rhodococcus sp. 06-156-4C]OZD32353.1 hypothetical protein CH284_20900 [Rhodococcus sp. 06-156-3]OZD36575.1 hypothetical protein CH247_03325 [Rhodococcus sp. 06-156-3b]
MPATIDVDGVTITSPDVHADAQLSVSFHRTLRVPDDGSTYDLPPSLGTFPLRGDGSSRLIDADTHASLPMWQAEACWIDFSGRYPYLVTIGSGAINAVTGGQWSPVPDFAVEDYFEVPEQPWLDGFNVGEGEVRQFVAMPLGRGIAVEEQLSSASATGGINVAAYPLKASKWEEMRPSYEYAGEDFCALVVCASPPPMGLAGGGSIRQSIKTPVRAQDDWDLEHGVHFRVNITNSDAWEQLTGERPPTLPPTAAEYARRGLPWFTWYDDATAPRRGSEALKGTSSVSDFGGLLDNDSFAKPEPHVIGPKV